MVNYDGPSQDLAERMAQSCGYTAEESVGYPTPGSMGSYTGIDFQTPTITLELGPEVTEDNVWERFREALFIFLELDDDS